MDRRKLLLLKFFLSNCSDGYKVIDIPNIFENNTKYNDNFSQLEEDIDYLKKYKFIDVKYFDENSICLSVLDNSIVFQSNLKSDKLVNRKVLLIMIISMAFSGLMAFIGAFLAIIFVM